MVGKKKGSDGKPLTLASMVVKKKASQGMSKKGQVEATMTKNKRKRVVVDDDDDFQNPSSVNEEQALVDSGNRDQAGASSNVLTKGLIRKKMQGKGRGLVSREDVVGASNKPSDGITQSVELVENRLDKDLTSRRGRKQKVVETVENESDKETKRQYYSIFTRTSPKTLYTTINSLSRSQQARVIEMGFGSLLKMKLDGIPSKLGYFVVDNYDPDQCVIRTAKGQIQVTKESIHDMIGAPVGGVDLGSLEVTDAGIGAARRWRAQFDKKKVRPGDVLEEIKNSKVVDLNFTINFLVLFTNIMARVKGNGICETDFVEKINGDTNIANIDWCGFIFESLVSCKAKWTAGGVDCYFCGALSSLVLHYVDSVRCNGFEVKRRRPAIQGWSMESLRRREKYEKDNGGFGLGDLYPPFQEDEDFEETELVEDMLEQLDGVFDAYVELKERSDSLLARANEKYPNCPEFQLWDQKLRALFVTDDVNVAGRVGEGNIEQDQAMNEGGEVNGAQDQGLNEGGGM